MTKNATTTSPTVALCVIFRDNYSEIDRLLESVDGHFDEYVFCDTGSKDGTRNKVDRFMRNKDGKVINFTWIDDFAAARQASFEAATATWRMFLDTDDALEKGELVRKLVSMLAEKNPDARGVFLPYHYDQDEDLHTMRLCRWFDPDGHEGWRWHDAIHERLEYHSREGSPTPENTFAKNDDVKVSHLHKTKEQKDNAIRRNARIAEREYTRTDIDDKYRARLARTLAMELKMDAKTEETIPYQEMVYSAYPHFPEGRQAAADLVKAYLTLFMDRAAEGVAPDADGMPELLDKALAWGKKAGPSYEAMAYHARGDFAAAVEKQTKALGIPQQTTHEGFFFERAFGFAIQADSLAHMGKHPDSIERTLNHIRADLRVNPVNFPIIHRIRQSIDRITILVPNTPQPFDEDGADRGMIGGSEEAVIYLSRALATQGRFVRVYAPLPPFRVPGRDQYGVDWQTAESFKPTDEHGTLVVWRAAGLGLQLAQIAQKTPLTGIQHASLWLHDRGTGMPPEMTEAALRTFDSVVVLSQHHLKMMKKACSATGDAFGVSIPNAVTLSNGIHEPHFAPFLGAWDNRDPNRVIYSSCPSRGLIPLLEMWPRVKEACPKAYLDIYYDWSMLQMNEPHVYEKVMTAYGKVQHLDVKHHGGVDHHTLNDALRGANVWAYSHFENTDVETFCISAVKALACGATVLTSQAGALPEVTGPYGVRTSSLEEYEARLIGYLKEPMAEATRLAGANYALNTYGWRKVAKRFSDVWTVRTNHARPDTGHERDVSAPASDVSVLSAV